VVSSFGRQLQGAPPLTAADQFFQALIAAYVRPEKVWPIWLLLQPYNTLHKGLSIQPSASPKPATFLAFVSSSSPFHCRLLE